jgi:hypothetical protein
MRIQFASLVLLLTSSVGLVAQTASQSQFVPRNSSEDIKPVSEKAFSEFRDRQVVDYRELQKEEPKSDKEWAKISRQQRKNERRPVTRSSIGLQILLR